MTDVSTSLVTLLHQDLSGAAPAAALWQLRPRRAVPGPLGPSTSEAAIRSVART